MSFSEYKEQLLCYLKNEKELIERDIALHQELSAEEKVEQGYLIKDCEIVKHIDEGYELNAPVNNTKLRAGDKVVLIQENSPAKINAEIIENFFNQVSIKTKEDLSLSVKYDIEVKESLFLDPLIKLLDKLEDGSDGAVYLEELCGVEEPDLEGYDPIDIEDVELPSRFNEIQRLSVATSLKRPSLYCIQGPPGTGKTDVLATLAKIFSENGNEVLVVSNTHQAVNNALNAIALYSNLTIVKIGEALKAQELNQSILKPRNINTYLRQRPRLRHRTNGTILGMTLHAAVINMGLCNNAFAPTVVLVDEAGQIPLTYGAAIGAFGAGSVIFIGDDRQLPPIFHPEMKNDELSVSVFNHVSTQYPDFKITLNTTYRMNHDITKFVSENFYEPFGVSLNSVREPKYEKSIEVYSLPIDKDNLCEDFSIPEAQLASNLALKYTKEGAEVAVITPFRKQVNCIRGCLSELFDENGIKKIPLVDTVERLQGQSVDVIIISTAVSDLDYYYNVERFVLEPHRLNVMCSRAKDKVIFVKSDTVTWPDNQFLSENERV